jgi:hypothetical protein
MDNFNCRLQNIAGSSFSGPVARETCVREMMSPPNLLNKTVLQADGLCSQLQLRLNERQSSGRREGMI